MPLLRTLTDRGTEYCGNPERHEYELYLAVEDIDQLRTKTRSPQTNGIVERFHKTVLNEFYRTAFRKKICSCLSHRRCRSPRCFLPPASVGANVRADWAPPLWTGDDRDAFATIQGLLDDL